MSVVVYPAVVTPDEAAGLQGRFVDFPAVTFSAVSAVELLRTAREALTAELHRLERQGDTWPEPSALGDLTAQPGATAMLVDVSVDDTPIRLTISLGERLLKRIDQDAEARSMTRSGYLALGARRLLGETAESSSQPHEAGLGGETGQKLREEVEALGRCLNETLGPNSPVGRTLAELDAIALDGLRRLGGELRSVMGAKTAAPGPDRDARRPASEPPPSDGSTGA